MVDREITETEEKNVSSTAKSGDYALLSRSRDIPFNFVHFERGCFVCIRSMFVKWLAINRSLVQKMSEVRLS